MYMLRGATFEDAKKKAESRDKGETSRPKLDPKRSRPKKKPDAGRRFVDDTASVG